MVEDFARFLLENHSEDVARGLFDRMRERNVPLLRHLDAFPVEARVKNTAANNARILLEALAGGGIGPWISHTLGQVAAGKLAGANELEALTLRDVVVGLAAYRQALLDFLPEFRASAKDRAWIADRLDQEFTEAQAALGEALVEIQGGLTATLRRTAGMLEEAQRIGRIGSWEWDVPADSVTWSDELCRVWGRPREDCPTTYPAYLDSLHPEDRDRVDAIVRNSYATGEDFTFEHRIVWPDGDLRWIDSRGSVNRDSEGTVLRMAGVAMDITERKLAREELARRSAELEEANAHLQELDRLKDDFLSVISHELRTPLNFIMGFASVLDERVVGQLNDKQGEAVTRILEGAFRMLRLVENLLGIGRMQAGQLDLLLARVDVAQVAREVFTSLRPIASARKIALELEAAGPLEVQGDAQRLYQVLANLVENAIKFSSPGGAVEIAAIRDGDGVRVTCTDRGCGIAAEDLPRLFRRFSQLDRGAQHATGGVGLGLSIAKALVEAHGGEIGVDSSPGEGSSFWFRLKAATEAPLPG